MNCEKAQKLLLLDDSGELSEHIYPLLQKHMRGCEPCREFQHILGETRETVEAVEGPSEKVLQNIRREARILAPTNKHQKTLYWKPAFAMAAAALIGLGLFFSSVRPEKVGLELVLTDAELLETSEQIVSVMYEGFSEDDLAFNFLMTYEETEG
jgi:hypothetical protein